MLFVRLTNYVRFQGFANRKNKLPVGAVIVVLLVPLAVVTPPLADQLAGVARLLFCCKVQPVTFCQYTVTMLPE